MEKLLKKDVKFCWDADCQQSLNILKGKMVTAPIIVFLYWKKIFHVHVDMSYIALGVVLEHPREGYIDHYVASFNRKFSKVERKYGTT